MLNEQQINALPNIIEQRLVAVNNIYLQMMGKRIKEIGMLSATDAHRLAQMSTFSDINKIIAELAEISEKNIADLYELFDAVAQENAAFSEQFYKASGKPFIPYEQNEELKKYVHALARQTAKEYSNLSQHTAFMVFKGGKKTLTSLSQTYTDIIDMAVTKTSLGLDGYQATMRQSLRQLAQSGIRTADYATGYTRRLDTAVRQNVLWGIKTCSQGIQDITGKEFGADGYEISYHANPRPSHVDMGGKQYTKKEYHQQGIDLLLSDYGCLHFKFSIICGVSKPNWDENQLAKMKANDNRTIEFEGKAYTGYEATQMQRKIETAIRHSKDATNLFKASGDTVGRLAEQGKLNALVDKYSAFSKQAGLRVKKERMSVSGYRPVKASLIDKEEYTELIKKIGINNAPKTLDIYHQIKYNKTKEYDLLQNFSKYKSTVPSATLRQYELYAELKELKLIKGTVVPYESHHAYILEDLSHKRDPSHIMKRMKERHITDDEVQKYVDNALFVEQQFKGTRLVYYSQYGVTVLTKTSDYVGINWIAKTVWNKTDFDANTYKILEVGRKHAK